MNASEMASRRWKLAPPGEARRVGAKGGRKRRQLSAARRREIAQTAALARWAHPPIIDQAEAPDTG